MACQPGGGRSRGICLGRARAQGACRMNSTRPLSALRHRAILITGGCGFIGCNLANALAERGRSVIAFDSLEREGSRENALWLKSRHGEQVEIKQGDVRDMDATGSQGKREARGMQLAG